MRNHREEPYDEDNLLFTIGNSLYKYALIINANIKERLGIINQELLIFRLTEDSKYKRKAFPRINLSTQP